MKTSLMAGASRFAHFAGLARASKKADDDDQNNRAAEDEDGSAEDDEDDTSAEQDDDGKDASDDDGDEQPAGKKGKRGKAAEEDEDDTSAEDDEDELNGKSASAQARRREQARIAHILGNKAAANNLPLALSLACETRMSRQEAVRVLKSQAGFAGAAARDEKPNRHARSDRSGRNVNLGSDSQSPSGRQAMDASWTRAFGKAGVKPR